MMISNHTVVTQALSAYKLSMTNMRTDTLYISQQITETATKTNQMCKCKTEPKARV